MIRLPLSIVSLAQSVVCAYLVCQLSRWNQQPNPALLSLSTTVIGARMSQREWRETKEQLIWWPDLALLGCCLVSLHFQCNILAPITVHLLSVYLALSQSPPAKWTLSWRILTTAKVVFRLRFVRRPFMRKEEFFVVGRKKERRHTSFEMAILCEK